MTDAGCDKAISWLNAHPSEELFIALYRELAARGRAGDMAEDGVRRGFAAAAAAWAGEQTSVADDSRREFWRALENAFTAAGWRCESCGYQAENFSWQCHNCLAWESLQYARQT